MAILPCLVSECLISTQVWMSFKGLYPYIKTIAGRIDAFQLREIRIGFLASVMVLVITAPSYIAHANETKTTLC